MQPGYWIVKDIGTGEREVVYLDEDGEVWCAGCDFSLGTDQFQFIHQVDLNPQTKGRRT